MNEGFVDLLNNPAALQQMLRETGLSVNDKVHQARLAVHPLTGGVSSNIFRIELDGKNYCIKQALPKLKVASDWQAPIERVFAEIDWIKTVAQWQPHNVPEIVATHPASGSFIMRFLDGKDWPNWKTELLAGRVERHVAERIGAILGRIHQASARTDRFARQFANAANFRTLRLDPYLLECARKHPRLSAQLHHLVSRTEANTLVLTHGDVSPKNILLNRHAHDEPLLLDAECANYGDPAFDLAFLLNHFVLKAIHMPDARAALLQSFDAIWDAYRVAITWESETSLQARSASLLAGLLLARIDGKSPVEYLNAADRDRVRRLATPLVEQSVDRLGAIRDTAAQLN